MLGATASLPQIKLYGGVESGVAVGKPGLWALKHPASSTFPSSALDGLLVSLS